MRLDLWIVSIAVVSLILVGSMSIFGELINTYDVNTSVEDTFNGSYDKIDDLYELSQDQYDSVYNAEIEGEDQSWESMTKGGYTGVRYITSSFGLFGNIINDISKQLGVPSFLIKFATIIVTILLVFAAIYLVFRYKP